MTIKIHGGLGNQMFQFAFGRALSLKHGAALLLDPSPLFDITPRKNFAKRQYAIPSIFLIDPPLNAIARFEKNIKIPYGSTVFNKYYPLILGKLGYWKYIKEKSFSYDKAMVEVNQRAYFDGYWQSEKYFDQYKEIIRKDFTFRHPISERSRSLMEDISSHNSVCLHVRRGDYIHNPKAREHHNVVTEDYYDRALSILKEKMGRDIKVFIFSDDIAWCRNNMKIDMDHIFIDDEHAGVNAEGHLHLMSLCKHFVIPNSSFSWWAAWLSKSVNKTVIAPKKWLNDNVDMTTITPPEWLRI